MITALLPLLFQLTSLLSLNDPRVANLIDWKVGDAAEYSVTFSMGLSGTMTKKAIAEEGNALWVEQVMKLPILSDESKLLFDRESGKVLRYIHNGKEEKFPESKIEVISSKPDVVHVPAGKFKVVYIEARSEEIESIELWASPRELALEGTAKTHIMQGWLEMTMELTKFTKN